MSVRRLPVIYLYDYAPERADKHVLRYVNAKPSKDNYGVYRLGIGTPSDPMKEMYLKGMLTGQALEDAQSLWPIVDSNS